MKTFKKLFALLLILATTFTLFSCGSEKADGDNGGKDSPVSASEKSDGDSFSSNGAVQAVKSYFASIENVDVPSFVALMPAFDRLLYSSATEADFENEIKDLLGAKLEHYEAECGSNTVFEIKVIAVNDVSEKVLSSMKEIYAEDENLTGTEIGVGSEIEFEIAIKGSESEVTGNGLAHVIQENGEWKIHNMNLEI